MNFRTEIEPLRKLGLIKPDTCITLLGSCFADNIGKRLVRDGFDAVHNPMGPLYNPISLGRCIIDAIQGKRYDSSMFLSGPMGNHCLDYASRYCDEDADALSTRLNNDLAAIGQRLTDDGSKLLCVTFGTAWVFSHNTLGPIGNCHKFPSSDFSRKLWTVDDLAATWQHVIEVLPKDLNIILTVSPIRHLADGLHGNKLSKATLLLTADKICAAGNCTYFPAYEILEDDLRDYRFYADDLKHPSEFACDYIYEHFCDAIMTPEAITAAIKGRKASAAAAHRPNISI